MASSNRRPPAPGSNPSRSSFSSNPPKTPNARPSSSSTTMNSLTRSPSQRTPNSLSRPARGVASRPPSSRNYFSSDNSTEDTDVDDARGEHALLTDELRERLRKAEIASEDSQRQLNILQEQLKDSMKDYGNLEEQLHESQLKVDNMEVEKLSWMREKNQLEKDFDSERVVFMAGQAEAQKREEDMQHSMKRLKENFAQRELRMTTESSQTLSRSSSLRSRNSSPSPQFAPQSADLQRSDSSQSSSRLILQKDRLIENLRLELAEAQIKVVELENMGGDRLQLLEKQLLEARISNARLMDDNESFQLLLSEKTLNGDFAMMKPDTSVSETGGLGSLAEELESAEGESDNSRKLEVEAKSLRDQNKALALYVENIIGRLLSHKEFENVLEKNPDLMSGNPSARPLPSSNAESSASYQALTGSSRQANADKDLPPPPPPKDTEAVTEQQAVPSLLQRARSVVGGPKRARPMSINFGSLISSTSAAAAHPDSAQKAAFSTMERDENISKNTSIPLTRSHSIRTNPHRRSQSDMPPAASGTSGTATPGLPSGPPPLVNQMYRGPPSSSSGSVPPTGTTMSPGLRSPNISATGPARTSFFPPSGSGTPAAAAAGGNPPGTPSSSRNVSAATNPPLPPAPPHQAQQPQSSASSTFSGSGGSLSGGTATATGPNGSPSRNVSGGTGGGSGQAYPGAIMSQNRLRPLRLVQENNQDEAMEEKARKKANRASWMPGWMGGGGGSNNSGSNIGGAGGAGVGG